MAPVSKTNGARTTRPIPLAAIAKVFFKPLKTRAIGLVILDQTLPRRFPILEKACSIGRPIPRADLANEDLSEPIALAACCLILLKFLPIAPPPLAPKAPPTVDPIKLPTPAPTAVPAPGTMEPSAPPIQAPATPPAAVPPVAPAARPIFSLRLRRFMPISSVPPAITEPTTGIREAVRRIIPRSLARIAALPAPFSITEAGPATA